MILPQDIIYPCWYPLILRTGATGYIGGDVLSQLEPKYPGIIFRVLTRDEQKGKLIKEQHPAVQIVSGDLNDAALLQEESAQADIILRELLPH